MGYGILAVACLCLLTPIQGGWYSSEVSFSLYSLLFLLLFLGIYAVYRRIASKWLIVSLWICAGCSIIVLYLPYEDAYPFVNAIGPCIFPLVLQGSKHEMKESTQKQVRHFIQYFLLWYGSLLLVTLFDFMNKALLITLVLMQIVMALWLFYLCIHINQELKELNIRKSREKYIPHTKRNTLLMTSLLFLCAAILYGLQFPYQKEILQHQPILPEAVLYHSEQEDAYMVVNGWQNELPVFSLPRLEIGMDAFVLYKKADVEKPLAYSIEQRIYVDGVEKEEARLPRTQVLTDTSSSLWQTYSYTYPETITFLKGEEEQVQLQLFLYDEEEQLIYEQRFPLQIEKGTSMYGEKDGIQLHDLRLTKGGILRTADIELSMGKVQKLQHMDHISYEIQYYEGDTLLYTSPIVTQEIPIASSYHNGESRLWLLFPEYPSELLEGLQEEAYTQAIASIRFYEQKEILEQIEIPLEVIP